MRGGGEERLIDPSTYEVMAKTEKHINRDVKRQRKRNWRTKTAKDTARRKIEIQVQRHRITDRSRGAREREREEFVLHMMVSHCIWIQLHTLSNT